MDITHERDDGKVTLLLRGRLDAYWAGHLAEELDALVRTGETNLVLDLDAVDFLSSAGIGIVLKYFKILRGMHGSLSVVRPQPLVRNVLDLSGLTGFLLADEPAPVAAATAAAGECIVETELVSCAVHVLDASATLTCAVIGSEAPLAGAGYSEETCVTQACRQDRFGLGIGAIGSTFADCADRFGEIITFGGATFHLPALRGAIPDYEMTREAFVPETRFLSAMLCQGGFSHFVRFESRSDRHIPLSALLRTLHGITADGADAIGFVICAETSGLVGAWLKRSPIGGGERTDIFGHPGIQQWLGYTSEPVHGFSLVWMTGILSSGRDARILGAVRPLPGSPDALAHVHALAIAYRHLPKGVLDLTRTVSDMFDPDLFDSASMLGQLHLVSDDRPVIGRGESELVRGVCWAAPIETVTS